MSGPGRDETSASIGGAHAAQSAGGNGYPVSGAFYGVRRPIVEEALLNHIAV